LGKKQNKTGFKLLMTEISCLLTANFKKNMLNLELNYKQILSSGEKNWLLA